jgi:hypothetical protein
MGDKAKHKRIAFGELSDSALENVAGGCGGGGDSDDGPPGGGDSDDGPPGGGTGAGRQFFRTTQRFGRRRITADFDRDGD